MATVVTKFPGTIAAIGGSYYDWTNPDRVKANDASYASAGNALWINRAYAAKAYNFAFAIPAASTITKLTIRVEAYDSGSRGDLVVEANIGGLAISGLQIRRSDDLTGSPVVYEDSITSGLPSIAQLNDNSTSGFNLELQWGDAVDAYCYVDYVQAEVEYEPWVVPTVTTAAISSIAWDSATGGGGVSSAGGGSISDKGICWNTTGTPTIADSHTHNGTGGASFSDTITPLTENTVYHVRAYAVNEVGIAYGPEVDFTSAYKPTYFLAGAVGRTTAWNRALSAAEVLADFDADQVIYDRSMAKGTVVIQGTCFNRQGAPVPAHHVRAGWLIQNLAWQPDPTLPPPTLYITGHSVDLAAKKNALTIGVDWMEKEIGVRMAELLAIPATVVPDAVEQDAVDPWTPEPEYEPEPEYKPEPYVDPGDGDMTDPGDVPDPPAPPAPPAPIVPGSYEDEDGDIRPHRG